MPRIEDPVAWAREQTLCPEHARQDVCTYTGQDWIVFGYWYIQITRILHDYGLQGGLKSLYSHGSVEFELFGALAGRKA